MILKGLILKELVEELKQKIQPSNTDERWFVKRFYFIDIFKSNQMRPASWISRSVLYSSISNRKGFHGNCDEIRATLQVWPLRQSVILRCSITGSVKVAIFFMMKTVSRSWTCARFSHRSMERFDLPLKNQVGEYISQLPGTVSYRWWNWT